MKVLLIGALSLITAASAFAQYGGNRGGMYGGGYGQYGHQLEQIPIELNQHLTGVNIIPIKMELKRQHPNIDIQNLEVESVRVVAKSARGMGEAVLISGQQASYPVTIKGTPGMFQHDTPASYDRVLIQNPSHSSFGKLQLELKGNIKIKRLVVIAKDQMLGQQIVINLGGQVMQGQNSIIPLKRLAVRQNPRLNLEAMDLKKVTLIAKSARGMGQATLVVGQSASYPETIGGTPGMFHTDHPSSFDHVTLMNPSFSSMGKWQVELNGNIKVKQVILTVTGAGTYQPIPSPRPRPRPTPGPRPRPGRRGGRI